MSNGKDEAEKTIVKAGASIGSAIGGVAVGTAAANVAAASAATASSASLATMTTGTVFAAFGHTAVVTNPAVWAVVLTNPVGAAVAVSGLAAVGAYGAFKLTKILVN